MRRILLTLLTLSTLILARNDVPSCYKALQIDNPNEASQKELFILVDQTTILDKNLMIYTYKNMMKFIKNGYAVTIASFSSNAKGKYTDVAYAGKLEALLPQSAKHDIAKKKLRKYQGCMNGQYKYAKKKATKALVRVLKGASKKLPHSDILKSLDDISKHIIRPSSANQKVVLVVSDMIEHSSITTFYTKGSLKKVDTKKEMAKIKKSGHIANFSGARVYVIGAGMIGKESYRDSNRLGRLSDFWKAYFAAANAQLKAIGTPMLLEDVE
jgi:primase-polymerase (primpol)-like protein